MPIAGPTSTPNDVNTREAGMLLIGAGAILLFISLFLEWYQRGTDAFEAFEAWDLVLAMLAIATLAAVASRFGFGPPRPASWLIGPAVAALVIVLFAIVNPPPVAAAIDDDPSTGLWLALAATILMAAGAVLSFARISVALAGPGALGDPRRAPVADPARPGGPVADPVSGDAVAPHTRRALQPCDARAGGRRPGRSRRTCGDPAHRADAQALTPAVVTIGVYEFDAGTFLDALRGADVRLVIDVRQRRGVRGPRYAWANALRLQAALAQAHVAYSHHRELAPTTELRRLQYAADDRAGVGKRSRVQLDAEYRERYVREILDRADLGALVAELPGGGAAALLCVEAQPEACHRSLIAQRLAERHGIAVGHLRP